MSRLQPVIGTEIVDDIRLGHTWYEYNILKDFIIREKPEYFIEIGIHEGGLAYCLLREKEFFTLFYIGIEVDCKIIRPEVRRVIDMHLASELLCRDCFDRYVHELIKNLNNKVIYCDGGHKAKELKHFKSACNSGDIILAHDFYDGTRIVRDVPVENISIEVTADDIYHMEIDETFERLNEKIFRETRIIGWRKL